MKKKILVTGAGGFIGHHLVRELTRCGHSVVAVDPAFYDSDMNRARSVGEIPGEMEMTIDMLRKDK